MESGTAMRNTMKLLRIAVVLASTAMLIVSPGPASAAPAGCDTNIEDEADLLRVAGDPDCLDETLTQVTNITLTTDPWVPIANFEGTYDGNSYSITGLRLNGNNAGLFGVGNAGATIKNLAVTVSASNGGNNVGAIVGLSGGRLVIQNVQAYGTVTGSAQVGGLVGSTSNAVGADGTRITNSSFTGTVSASGDEVGGLLGRTSFGAAGTTVTITNSTVDASISGAEQVGGLVGSTSDEDVIVTGSSLVGSGSITGTGNDVGGLVGRTANGGAGTSITITNSSASRSVSGASAVGGLLGGTGVEQVAVTGSSKTGSTTVQGSGRWVGGLVGSTGNGAAGTTLSISQSTASGNVVGGDDYVGGLLGGSAAHQVTISASSRISGLVQGSGDSVGGLIGETGNGAGGTTLSIDGGVANGNVIGAGDYVGGMIGSTIAESLTVTNSNRGNGNVQAVGNGAGGLIGLAGGNGPSSRVAISTYDIVGNVSASANVGGVVGFVTAVNVSISAATITGNVIGSGTSVGGLVGSFTSGGGGTILTIADSGVVGNVTGTTQLGGLVGYAGAETISIGTSTITGNTIGNGGAHVGGLIGRSGGGGAGTNISLSSSSVNGDVTSASGSNVGGLLGYTVAEQVTVQGSSKASGDIVASGDNVGGLVGSTGDGGPNTTLRILSSTNVGSVTGSAQVGGLVGAPSAKNVTISASSSYGNVAGTGDQVGGLVGAMSGNGSLTIAQSFMVGNVSGSANVGGMLGLTWAANVDVTSAFARGNVIGSNSVGGIAGVVAQALTLTKSYFQGTATATNTVQGSFRGSSVAGTIVIDESLCTDAGCPGASKISIGDLQSESFLTGRGWDMTNVWCIRPAINAGFPALRIFTSGAFDTTACIPVPDPTPPPTPSSGGGAAFINVSLDPNGGVCTSGSEHSSAWTISILGTVYIPGPRDCTRLGHTFGGWADPSTPSIARDLPLLADPSDGGTRYFVSSSLILIAVWSAVSAGTPVPTPSPEVIQPPLNPAVFFGVRGWLCRNCGVLLFWSTPPTGSKVTVKNPARQTVCGATAVPVGAWTMCHLKSGRTGTYSLTTSNAIGTTKPVSTRVR